jgi:nitrite reductase/ring-hydroxylating ferredoxin subunit
MAASTDDARDATQGIPVADLTHDIVKARVEGEDVLIVKRNSDIFAIGAHCTHYHGPLAQGLVVGDTIRCSWHNACFAFRTGEAVRAPALAAVACWRVERSGDKIGCRRAPGADSGS